LLQKHNSYRRNIAKAIIYRKTVKALQVNNVGIAPCARNTFKENIAIMHINTALKIRQ